ncbi:methylmalonic aciduria type A homolog, mitochondrial-like [Argiope bruennichi]|uniref:Methylmalonic aciduria type A like protein n=1 Tax=Argiope bruennichi TaxID=94029 RepID=A0A8T0F0B1_ARGBR|nr:methylmalonic aciduria type A homolog, mitochondrial-like [Argiope bruennichi]KAF8784517.1 Methylmalonic aciduria type A like protein [Argiope bruennichi]
MRLYSLLTKTVTFRKGKYFPREHFVYNFFNSFIPLSNTHVKNEISELPKLDQNYKAVSSLFERLKKGERSALACAITLVESQHPVKQASAQVLLSLVLKEARKRYEKLGQKALSFRLGLTGPPGAGKSTFIESFGKMLTSKGHKVAVLAVDPSSSTTGGSLLGDKTRMTELSRDPRAYVRPSPASGCLGGVTRSTNEAIALCECAGYDIVIVETVGVGQSEFHVSYMVDLFGMIVSPAGGDELQGLKKGIVELVDMVIVNKADGDLIPSARRIQADYTSALKFVRRKFKLWRPLVVCVSSQTKEGISSLWEDMQEFQSILNESGDLELQRKKQYSMWMWIHIEYNLLSAFKKHPEIKTLVVDIERQVQEGIITPGQASDILLKKFLRPF